MNVKTFKMQGLMLAFIGLLMPFLATAAEGPKELVDERYQAFLQLVKDGTLNENLTEQELFALMEKELDPVVDFERIARKVMAKYSRQATPKQLSTFTERFKRTLVNTYSKGIENIDLLDTVEIDDAVIDSKGKRAKVNSVIKLSNGQQYQVVYSLFLDKGDQWKVENLVVEGVNIGIVFRNQFAQYMEQYGNLDSAITNWGK